MVENIIFDFGGVLVDLKPQNTFDAIRGLYGIELGQTLPSSMLDIFNAYECGAFGEASFMHRLQRLSDSVITERQLLDAWNAMLLDLPKKRMDWLLELRKEYKVYLLSNTNHTHIEWVRDLLRRHHGILNFESIYFDHAYYSHDIGMNKPKNEIYQYVIDHAGIDPKKSLFIDDSKSNVDAALAAGLLSSQHDPTTEIIEELSTYIAAWS